MTLQEEIITQLHVQPVIDPREEIEKSITFLKHALLETHLKTLVLGISGGQDSTLAGRLSQLAVEALRKETGDDTYRFIAIRLPYGKQADETDAQQALDFIQPDEIMTIDIKPAVDAAVESIEINGQAINLFNKGNMKARQRMIMQYAVAGERQGMVVGTDHAAENITGFFTKYGDGGADILPLYRLNKRQGKQLLETLGAPKYLYEKTPTADLEDDKPLRADEEALGVTYTVIDDYLEGKVIDDTDKKTIEQWWLKTQHKRQLPKTIFD